MSLVDSDSVDLIIRIPGPTLRAALIAVDDGRITEPPEREAALRRKLAAYVAFAGSDRLAAEHPELVGHELSIEVVCATPPTDVMAEVRAVRAADRPKLVLPVTVSETAAFRERLGLPGAEAA